jgi:hypothetical protein
LRSFGDSALSSYSGSHEALLQQIKLCAPKHLSFHHFQDIAGEPFMRRSACARPAKLPALSRSKRGKGRPASACTWHLHQPGNRTYQVDCRRNDQILEMRFGHPNVSAPPQITNSYTLRKHTFYARASGIGSLKVARSLPLSGLLHSLVVLTMAQRQFATSRFGAGAVGTDRTVTTAGLRKRDVDDGLPMTVTCRFPFPTELPLGTAYLLLVPINDKAVRIESSLFSCLPASISWDWSKQCDRERAALEQACPIDVTRIKQVFSR